MSRAATSDLSAREFRNLLLDNGFAFLGRGVDAYIDLHHPRRGRIEAIKEGARICRQATFDALLAARGKAEAEKKATEAMRSKLEAAAARIAPTALPACRADLKGAAAVAQLADDFVTASGTIEGVTFASLIQKGWRATQLNEHGPAARAVADRRQSLMVAR